MSVEGSTVIRFPRTIRAPEEPRGPEVGDVVAEGRYALLECLGEGGLGKVFLADDLACSRRVAIKTLVPRYFGRREREQRLFDEFRYLERIKDRRYVVEAIECGRLPEHDEWPFMVMEHVEGPSLYRRMLHGRIMPAELIDIGLQVARGIQAIHRARVVHRDITPQNILLLDGKRTQVKIIDFSHGADADAPPLPAGGHGRLTGMHEVPGTPQYMPPEQASAMAAGPRMDVYSFGIVLYEMITGRNPFAGMSRDVYIGLQRQEALQVEPLDPRVYPDLPESLLRLVGRCLRESTARPAIELVIRRFEAVARPQPQLVRPVVVGEAESSGGLDVGELPWAELAVVEAVAEAPAAPVVERAPVSGSEETAEVPERAPWAMVGVPAAIVVLLVVAIMAWTWEPGLVEPELVATPSVEERDSSPGAHAEAPRVLEPIEQPQIIDAPPGPTEQPQIIDAPRAPTEQPQIIDAPRAPVVAKAKAKAKASCEGVIETAKAARAQRSWTTVVKHTSDRSCWASAPADRLAWRMEALSELRRWDECAQLGGRSKDPRVKFMAEGCRARLEIREDAR